MPLTYSAHATQRMNERGISEAFVQATVDAGNHVLQSHGTRLYTAQYSYNVVIPTPMQVAVVNQYGQQMFDQNWMPMLQWVTVNLLNTITYQVSVVTNGAGTHVVTVWWT
jgi:hypothetical protein